MSIEGADLEHFSSTDQETSSSYLHILIRHAMFHSFLSDNSKQEANTTSAYSKRIIERLKKINA